MIIYDDIVIIIIQLFVSVKRKSFGTILFLSKSQRRRIPQRLLDKCNNLFICNLSPVTYNINSKINLIG